MKLYYFKDPHGNFGDDLNPWLWSQLIPELFDDRDDELFVGVGTLINHRLPIEPIKHVFGSGFGYGNPPILDDRFVFHAVRGPDTARMLGLPMSKVVTDAAVLVRAVGHPKPVSKTHRFGLILTGQSIAAYDWESVCRDLGILYISCHWDVETVLEAITSCQTILCEAMHGAIVADALRVPWVPVCCNDDILAFKWQDWLSTISLQYEPTRVASLFDSGRNYGVGAQLKNSLKRSLKSRGLWSERWADPVPRKTGHREREAALMDLRSATARMPFLGSQKMMEEHMERFLDLLNAMRVAREPHALR